MVEHAFESISLTVFKRIAWLKFNRPEQLNAMNKIMMGELISALDIINCASADDIGVCVITGAGKAFMAGADIKEYAQQSLAEFEAFQTKGRNLYASIEGNSKTIIAAVNGYAFGGGFEIALACDMIVARQYSKLGLPEINLNLIPGGGGTQRLAKKLGTNIANELIMTGRVTTAEELKQLGLINHVYEKATYEQDVAAFATELAAKPSDRLQVIKQLTQLSVGGTEMAAQAIENSALSRFYQSAEGQEKIQDFALKSESKKQ